MPRVKAGAMEYAMTDFVRAVRAQAALKGLESKADLAKACGMDYQHLQRRMLHPEMINLSDILIIGNCLKMGQDGVEPIITYWGKRV